MNFYVSIFKNAKILNLSRDGNGKAFTGTIEIEGQKLHVLNGGPRFKLNESFSLMINCETQEEVDNYWNKLISDGGEESMCGWCKDKFGLWWQVIPKQLGEFLSSPDREKANRAMQAMFTMRKIDIAKMSAAFEGN